MYREENEEILAAEEYLLGCSLIDKKVFAEVSAKLCASDFYFVPSQLIFSALDSVFQERGETDPVLIGKHLRNNGDIKRAGGLKYLGELHFKVPETKNVGFYVEIIAEQSCRRRLKSIASRLSSMANDESLSPSDAIAKIKSEFEGIAVTTSLEAISAPELLAMKTQPVKWVVDELIPSGLTVLAGDAKIGKSFLCWNLALAVAHGGIAISRFNVPSARNTTYIALEDPLSLIAERIHMLSFNEIPPDRLKIMNTLPANLKFNNAGIAVIDNYIKESGTEFLIVDTWKHVRPEIVSNGSAYDIDYQSLIPVQKLAHNNDIAILLVTHTRKSPDIDNPFNQIQGSMGVQAGCDTILMLTKSNSAHSLHVTGRRIAPDEHPMEMSDGIWKALTHNEKLENDMNHSENSVFTALREYGDKGMTFTEAVELTGLVKPTVKSTLRRMVDKGLIVQPNDRGKYYLPNGNGNHNGSAELLDIPW